MMSGTVAALAGLGFFLAGLHMLSEAIRALSARYVRTGLRALSKLPLSGPVMGILLGALTQSTSAAAFVCMGLLNSRAITFPAALSISAWTGVGTSVLVFLASVDLRLAALGALALLAVFYLAALHRHESGKRSAELLISIGLTLLGLAMVKETGQGLQQNAWAQEFFIFASTSWVYGFVIGLVITLVMQSSSTVSIITVALGAAGLLPLQSALVIVCGANLGSGLSIVLASSHFVGLPRQLAVWQAIVKTLGSLAILVPVILLAALGSLLEPDALGVSLPMAIALAYLALNVTGAVLAALLQRPLIVLLQKIAPIDTERQQYDAEFLIDEAAEDPETALMLARREYARLVALMPIALAPLRPEEEGRGLALDNAQRRRMALDLAQQIESFISLAVTSHPQNADVGGLLLLQRYNGLLQSLMDALHSYVEELEALRDPAPHEVAMRASMTETLHFLLGLVSEHANGEGDAETMERLTRDRGDIMTRFRGQIVQHDTASNANREALFVATGLFERMVWLVRELAADPGALLPEVPHLLPER
jgi:phosphate:Na+ symporter